MLTIEAMADGAALVDAVYDPVGVVLHRCGKNDYFIEFTQFCKKLVAVWPDHIEEVILAIFKLLKVILIILHIILRTYKVNQRLIQVEHKSVWLVQYALGWQKWRMHLWQLIKQVIHRIFVLVPPGLALCVVGFCS